MNLFSVGFQFIGSVMELTNVICHCFLVVMLTTKLFYIVKAILLGYYNFLNLYCLFSKPLKTSLENLESRGQKQWCMIVNIE